MKIKVLLVSVIVALLGVEFYMTGTASAQAKDKQVIDEPGDYL